MHGKPTRPKAFQLFISQSSLPGDRIPDPVLAGRWQTPFPNFALVEALDGIETKKQ